MGTERPRTGTRPADLHPARAAQHPDRQRPAAAHRAGALSARLAAAQAQFGALRVAALVLAGPRRNGAAGARHRAARLRLGVAGRAGHLHRPQRAGARRGDGGRRNPLRAAPHATASGKLLYAYAGLPRPAEPLYTPRTCISVWSEEAAHIRAAALAATEDEWALGTSSLAVPLRAAGGEVLAALGVSLPTPRLREREALTRRLHDAAAEVAWALGARGRNGEGLVSPMH
ncbi:IclR family transcriptional regulator domain-containing protein (plasmid) [Deinococcus sp. PESE-38]